MERSVARLRVDETARFDPEKLEDLCRVFGEQDAEDKVARALERIAALLGAIAPGKPRLAPDGMRDPLEALIDASDLIGMATLARVARDVAACLRSGDAVALAATLARLQRVGDRSIHAVWDLEDVSG